MVWLPGASAAVAKVALPPVSVTGPAERGAAVREGDGAGGGAAAARHGGSEGHRLADRLEGATRSAPSSSWPG